MRSAPAALLLAAAVPLAAQPAAPPAATAHPRPVVWVTLAPQRWVVQRLAAEAVAVEVLIPAGQSHETYEPTPRQLAGLETADLYVRLGVPFEAPILARVRDLAPGLSLVDGSAGIPLAPMEEPLLAEGGHEHGQGQPDPHYWLDPTLLARHATTVCEALGRLLPADAATLRSNLDALRRDLDAADRRIAARLAPLKDQAFLVYHPAFGYFARRYGLRQLAAEVGGREPTARQLAGLVDAAKRSRVRVVFVQPQYSGRSAQALAEAIGARVVELDPVAEDVLANLETIAERIASAQGG